MRFRSIAKRVVISVLMLSCLFAFSPIASQVLKLDTNAAYTAYAKEQPVYYDKYVGTREITKTVKQDGAKYKNRKVIVKIKLYNHYKKTSKKTVLVGHKTDVTSTAYKKTKKNGSWKKFVSHHRMWRDYNHTDWAKAIARKFVSAYKTGHLGDKSLSNWWQYKNGQTHFGAYVFLY